MGVSTGKERVLLEKHLRQLAGEGFVSKGSGGDSNSGGKAQRPLISPEVAEERRTNMKV
jgi:hypothetical protein